MATRWLQRMGGLFAAGYDSGDSNRMRRDLGWDRATPRDEDSMVAADGTREVTRLKATDLLRNNAVVAGIGNRISLFTVGDGIIPQARTSDPAWNTASEEWFASWGLTCDSRKRASLYDLQRQATALRPIQGGLYLELLANGQVRPIECERIRQPQDPNTAKQYTDGVRVDKSTGRIVAYRVHARDDKGGFTEKHDEADVPAENLLPVVRPPWRPDQVREIPDLAAIVPALQDLHEWNLYALNTAKAQSMAVGFLKKLSGTGGNAFQRTSSDNATAKKRQMWAQEWGQIFEGFPGEEMEMMVSPTPNGQHVPYAKFHYALCAAALGFPYEFLTLDLSGLDFSRQKGMLLLVNHAIRPWRRWLCDRMLAPLWAWSIPNAIRRGELPPAPVDARGVSEFARVTWQAPEELCIDRQEAMQADTLEIQAGLSTFSSCAKRRGSELETLYRQKATDRLLAVKIAKETGVPVDEISRTQIPGQSPTGIGAAPTDDPDKPKKEGPPDADK